MAATGPLTVPGGSTAPLRRQVSAVTGFLCVALVAALFVAVAFVAWRAESSPQPRQEASTQPRVGGYPAVPAAIFGWLGPGFTRLDTASSAVHPPVSASAAVRTAVRRLGSNGATASRAHLMLAWVTDETVPGVDDRV